MLFDALEVEQTVDAEAALAAVKAELEEAREEAGRAAAEAGREAQERAEEAARVAIDEATAKELKSSIPLGRIGRSEEIAQAVLFLLGPGGDYVTGQTLVIDGGLSL